MKYKRNLIWLILVIAVLMSAGCKKNEEKKKEAETEEIQETKESKAVKESKVKKEKQEKNSKKPHILLNKMNEYAYDSYEGEYLYNLRSIKISLKEEEGFDSLRKAIEEYNEKMEEKYAGMKEDMDFFGKQEIENRKDGFNSSILKDIVNTYIMRSDESIVSILNYEEYNYTGAKTMYSRESCNFDTRTGKILSFLDVVKDDESFFELVDALAKKDYQESNITKPSEYAKGLKENDYKDLVWTVSPEGVTVYFDTETLGSFTDGPQVITVCFDEDDDLFESKYINKEKDYVFPILADNMTLHIDTDGDGERESVYVENKYEQDKESLDIYTTGLEIFVGDESKSFEDSEGSAYIVKKSGKYYVYVFGGEAEVSILTSLDLADLKKDDDKFSYLSLLSRDHSFEAEDNVEIYTYIEETFTDTDTFMADEVGYILGTIMTEREWYVGDEGIPMAKTERAKVNMPYVIRTLREVNCEEVDKDGKGKKSASIPEDSYLLFVYSDNESYVDVRVVDKDDVEVSEWSDVERHFTLKEETLPDYDGNCYRITLDSEGDEISYTIDGVDINEIFEGILFAG